MADTSVLGADAYACEFESRRLHQEKEMAFWPSPFLCAGGGWNLSTSLILPQGKIGVQVPFISLRETTQLIIEKYILMC